MEQTEAKPSLSLASLSIADFATLLTKVGSQPITPSMIEADLRAGAPVNADGSINLIHYAAWLVKETGDDR